MRSRVTAKRVPTSSSVWSERSPMPKRSRSTCSARGVSAASTFRVCSWRCRLITRAHEADVAVLEQIEDLQAAVHVSLGDRHDEAEIGLDQLLLGGARAELGGTDVPDGALEGGDRHAELSLQLGELAPRAPDLLGQRDERLVRHAELAACVLQRGPLGAARLAALAAAREAARHAEQLGRRAPRAAFHRLQLRPAPPHALDAGIEPARHSLDLPPREPEPAERAEESRLEARATLSEPRVLAAPIHEPARQRVARRDEPPHPPELRQEAPPQAEVLGGRGRPVGPRDGGPPILRLSDGWVHAHGGLLCASFLRASLLHELL